MRVGLPDLRGRSAVGVKAGDTNFGTLGQQSGEDEHILTIAELAAHTHTTKINDGVQFATPGTGTAMYGLNFAGAMQTSSTGSGTAHNNVQPSLALTPLIKT